MMFCYIKRFAKHDTTISLKTRSQQPFSDEKKMFFRKCTEKKSLSDRFFDLAIARVTFVAVYHRPRPNTITVSRRLEENAK